MNKNTVTHLTGLSLILISLLLLAGCQQERVAPVEAAPADSVLLEEAAARTLVNPADRKFYYGWVAPGTDVTGEVVVPANIAPADRKFYSSAYVSSVVARELAAAASIAPADRKFFIGAHEVSRAVEPVAGVDAADRKFYSGTYAAGTGTSGEVAAPANVAPADRKFFNARSEPQAGLHPADRKFFSGE